MGLVNWVSGVASGVDNLREAVTAPKRSREDALRRTRQVEQRRQSQLDAERGLQDQLNAADVENQITLRGLPTQEIVAGKALGLQLQGKTAENELQRGNLRLTGEETRQTLGVAGNEGRQTIGAKADADVIRMGGWADNVLPAFRENVIAPAQQHELALMDRTFGATAPLELSGQLEREQMGLQREMSDKQANDPFNRLEQLARIGAMAGSLFMV